MRKPRLTLRRGFWVVAPSPWLPTRWERAAWDAARLWALKLNHKFLLAILESP